MEQEYHINHLYYEKNEVKVYVRALGQDEVARVMELSGTAVDTNGKLASSWGDIKAR